MSEYGEVRGTAFVPTQEELKKIRDKACDLYKDIADLEGKYPGLRVEVELLRHEAMGERPKTIVSDISYSFLGRLSTVNLLG